MINGEKILRERYQNLDEKQYQPCGIDLTVGKIEKIITDEKKHRGIINGEKLNPEYEELSMNAVSANGKLTNVYSLEYNIGYLVTTKEKIYIDSHSAQFYKPRSTLLRQGVSVQTALGDCGFNGHLSFLIINHVPGFYDISKGERFAQLVDIRVDGAVNEYDGDYQESE